MNNMAEFNQQPALRLFQQADAGLHNQSPQFSSNPTSRPITRSSTRAETAKPSLSKPESMGPYQSPFEFTPSPVNNGFSSPLTSPPLSMPSTPTSPEPSLIVKLPVNAVNIKAKQDNDSPATITGKRKSRSTRRDTEDLNNSADSALDEPAAKRKTRNNTAAKAVSKTVAKAASKAAPKTTAKAASKAAPKIAYYINVQQDKPEPYGQPPIWADKRQQLCETLPYYRAYQSGAYTTDGLAYGFLCDKEVGDRDVFTDYIMIARVGGGKKMMNNTGKRVQTESQDISTIAKSFKNSQQRYQPIVVIAGQGNHISPSRLPHYYNILDWFHVTEIWCEKYDGLTRWMVRLEKINLNEKSWWSAKDAPHFPPNFEPSKVEIHICNACKKPSKLIYKQGWACLEVRCKYFFNFGGEVDDKTLEFTDQFLQERTQFQGADPGPLGPPLLTDQDLAAMGAFGFEEKCKKGIVCPKCGCCSRRIEWRQWVCENRSCDFTYSVPQRPISASLAISQGAEKKMNPKEKALVSESIRASEFSLENYQVFQYNLPGENGENIGFIRHYKANSFINQQKNGPNELFEEMQAHDLGLKRSASLQKGATGEVLTAHWATNWGAPYKYKVSQESTPFDQAPAVIIKAIKRLTWAGKEACTTNSVQFQDFNELLSVGYFEEGHMSYHDDGEKTLGPTVASISLGCESTMHFRPKSKNSIGKTDQKQNKNAKGIKKDILRIVLQHGDIMIMHGHKIQELYEHSLVSRGKLRFAMTCRYIRPEMMANEQERLYTLKAGALPPGSEQYDYCGDMQPFPTVGESSTAPLVIETLTAGAPSIGMPAAASQSAVAPTAALPIVAPLTAATSTEGASLTAGPSQEEDPYADIKTKLEEMHRTGVVTPQRTMKEFIGWASHFLPMSQQ